MGRSCSDYKGYGRQWLCKSDLTPKNLKDIKMKSGIAIDGWVSTGGMGHTKRVSTYSIDVLKDIFKK